MIDVNSDLLSESLVVAEMPLAHTILGMALVKAPAVFTVWWSVFISYLYWFLFFVL